MEGGSLMRSISEEFGINVRARRKELNKTQLELAELADLDIKTIWNIENGVANPTLLVIELLATALEVQPYELLKFDL